MKRHIHYLLILFITIYGLSAQNWTDTLYHPRNVVLEEFTGIYCGACPSGHVVAHEIDSANPGRVVVVGIHTSDNYSKPHPGSGHPDFRAPWVSKIYSQASCWYFPTAMVNRTLFDYGFCSSDTGVNKGMTRGSWAEASNEILADDSAEVNIGVRSIWNESTSTLSIDVELYYHNSQNINNRLNIALSENNLIGYQSSGGNDYEHNHVLRHMISSDSSNTWNGVKVDNIVPGEWQTFHFDYYVNTAQDTLIFEHTGYGHIDTVYRESINIDNCELAVYVTDFSSSNIHTGVAIHAKNDSTNSEPSSLSENIQSNKKLKVYPNPGNNIIYFDLPSFENGEIILWDLLGNTVLNKTIENKVTAVDVKTLNPGVYLYKLKTGQSIYSGKLMTY